jgi:aryl-phospho-beta-D-glucosidase BglC (GH1 family)
MNMEDFINSMPGVEHTLKYLFRRELGADKCEYIFESMMDRFITERDIAYIKSLGVNVIRLPLNYHHFEDDDRPFQYKRRGFDRLDWIIGQCEKKDIYLILDLHAAAGYQNTDWHCDNASRRSMFWSTPHFQERFYSLWEAIAEHCRDRSAVAGYNLMNEPMSEAELGRLPTPYKPNWDALNSVYRTTVERIRKVDSEHIIFLEGDLFSTLFSGLDEPFAENLVYSGHNYSKAGWRAPYPGSINGEYWDSKKIAKEFLEHESVQFCRRYNAPLWVGEFGGGSAPGHLNVFLDQIRAFDNFKAHWTCWTYKDSGSMGVVRLSPECEYFERLRHVLARHEKCGARPVNINRARLTRELEKVAELTHACVSAEEFDSESNIPFMLSAFDDSYYNSLLQPIFVREFKSMSYTEIDRLMSSFLLENCVPYAYAGILKKRLGGAGHATEV